MPQGVQSYDLPSALSWRTCPAGQLQPDARTPDKRPSGQAEQTLLPVPDAYVLGVQGAQVSRKEAPVAFDAVPEGQLTQVSIDVAATATLKVPLEHAVQRSAVPAIPVQKPAGHAGHDVALALL